MSEQTQPPSTEFLNANSLSKGGQLFVWSMRQWMMSIQDGRCVYRDLLPQYKHMRCEHGATLIDEMMCILRVSASRPLYFHKVRCPSLTCDELVFVKTLRALTHGDHETAASELGTVISGTLNRSFLRAAIDYLTVLADADLRITGANYLREVSPAVRH